MALDQSAVGLVFNIKADSKAARAEIGKLAEVINISIKQTQNFSASTQTATTATTGFQSALSQLNRIFGQAASVAGQYGGALGGAEKAASGLVSKLNTLASTSGAGGPVGIVVGAVVALGTALAVAAGAAFELSKSSADVGAKIFDLADKTGISVRNLDLFRRAAAEAGKGIDVVERSFDQFTSRLELGSKTAGEMSRTLKLLGLDPKTALQDVNGSLETVVRNLNNIDNAAIRGAKAQELFGLRNEAIIPILTRIGESLDAYEARIGSLGQITQQQAEKSKSFDVSLNLLNATFVGIGTSVGASLIPVFQSLVDLFQSLVKQAGEGLTKLVGFGKGGIQFLADVVDILNASLRATPAFIGVVKASLVDAADILHRFRAVIGDTAKTAVAFFSGDFAGAAASGAAAISGAKEIGANFGEKTRAAVVNARTSVQRELAALLEERKRLSITGKNTFNDPGKTTGGGDKIAQAKLQALREAEEAINRELQSGVEASRRAFDARAITIERLVQVTIQAENLMLAKKEAIYEQERAIIEKSKFGAEQKQAKLADVNNREVAARKQANDAIIKVQDERTKIEDQIFEQSQRARLQRDEAAAQAEIERVKRNADLKVISFTAADTRIVEIEAEIAAKRRAALQVEFVLAGQDGVKRQQIADQIAALDQQLALSAEQAANRRIEAQQKDLAAFKDYLRARLQIQLDIQREAVDAAKRRADDLERKAEDGSVPKTSAIQARTGASLKELELQKQINDASIESERVDASRTATNAEQREAIEKLSNQRRLQEEQKFQDESNRIKEEGRLKELEADSSSPYSIFGKAGQEAADSGAGAFGQFGAAAKSALDTVTEAAGNMQSILTGAFSAIGSGLGSIIESFILTGQAGPAAFKKLAAGVIASVVAQSAVKAIFEFAEGLAASARYDYVSATQHFASAKLYAVIAAVGAVAALGIGALSGGGGAVGPSGSGGSGSSGGSSSSGSDTDRTIHQGQRDPVVIQIRTEEGMLVRRIVGDYRNDGETRRVLRGDILGESPL